MSVHAVSPHGAGQTGAQSARHNEAPAPVRDRSHGPGGHAAGLASPRGDVVDLSPAARAFLDGDGPGKAADSPAHRARALIAEHPALAAMPFGKVVSALARGTLELPPSSDTTAETPAADETAPDVDLAGTEAANTVATDDPPSDDGLADAGPPAVETVDLDSILLDALNDADEEQSGAA